MQQEDRKAYDTLQQHFADIAGSNLDPTVLAAELFAAKIIGRARIVEASNPAFPPPNVKLQNILTEVMSSGKPGAFQDFVHIILKMDQCYWLGEKLINTYKTRGGEWVKAPMADQQQQSRVSQNESGAISYTGPPPPAPELKDLMHLRVSDWNRLGLALELDSYDLDIIEKDNPGDRKKQALKMFQLWLNSKPDASYEQLIKALREVGDGTVASSLCTKYGIRLPPPAASTGARSQPTMTEGYTQPPSDPVQPTQPGYVPHSYQQYSQNPSQFPPGTTHHSYPHHGYPPPESQYPPQQEVKMSGTDTPEYKIFFRNQAKIADTIGDINGLNDRIVAELYARRIVGKAVRDAADIRGPQVPEIQRVRPVVNAIIARIKGDKNMYYRVRDVLLSDDIIVDAPELAQYLPQVPPAEDEDRYHEGNRLPPPASSAGARSQATMTGGYTQPPSYPMQPTQPGHVTYSYQQYPQNPSQFPPGPTHQPVFPYQGYRPQESQYMYYGQPAPSTQLPPAGSSHHAEHQYTGAPMQRPSHQGANQGYPDPGNIIRRGDKPVLPKLLKFPGKRGKINIPEQIGINYKNFGIFLLKDDNGTIISGIERAKVHDADEINKAILQRWISGKGLEPFTWDTLVKCLRDTELNVLADEIEEVLR